MTNEEVLEQVKIVLDFDTSGLARSQKKMIEMYKSSFQKILKDKEKLEGSDDIKSMAMVKARLKATVDEYRQSYSHLSKMVLENTKAQGRAKQAELKKQIDSELLLERNRLNEQFALYRSELKKEEMEYASSLKRKENEHKSWNSTINKMEQAREATSEQIKRASAKSQLKIEESLASSKNRLNEINARNQIKSDKLVSDMKIANSKSEVQMANMASRERIAKNQDELKRFIEGEKTKRAEMRKGSGSGGTSFGGKIKNVMGYASAAFIASPYLLALDAIGTTIKETITNAIELNKNLYKLAAITKATPSEMKAIGDSISYVSGELNYSNKETVDFMITLSRMGVEAENIAKVSRSVAELSKISGSELGKTGELVIQTMNAFGKSFDDTDYIVNQMNRTINGSALDMEKYATILGYVSAAASEVDVTFEQANSMISLLANSGLKASTVGTSLRNILGELTKSGDSLTSVLAGLKDEGLSYADAMELVGKRSANALTILIDKFDDLQVAQAKALADITTTTSQVQLAQQSPMEKISKAKNKVTTAVELALGGQISSKDALSKLSDSEKKSFVMNMISNQLQGNVGADFLNMTVQQQSAFIDEQINKIVKQNPDMVQVLEAGGFREQQGTFGAFGTYGKKQNVSNIISDVVKAKTVELEKSKVDQTVAATAEKLRAKAKTGVFSSAYKNAGGGKDGRKAYNDAVYKTAELELRSMFQDAGLATETITKEMINQVSGLGMTRYANVDTKVFRVGEIKTSVKGLQGMGANQDAINNIRKLQEEEKKLIEEICLATNNSHPLCADKKGSGENGKVRTFDEVSAQVVGLGIKEELRAARDAVQALIEERESKVKSIQEYAGTEYYNNAVKALDDNFSASFKDVDDKFFGKDGIVTKAYNGDLGLIESSFSLLEDVKGEVAATIAAKFKGKEGSVGHKNALDKMDKDYATIKQKITSAQTGNVNSMGSARASLGNKARSAIVKNKSNRFSTAEEQEMYTSLLAKAAEIASGGSVQISKLEGDIQLLANQSSETANPFKRERLDGQADDVRKEIWEKERSLAKETLAVYNEAEKVVRARRAKIKEELDKVNAEYDADHLSISSMKDGDVNLARFGGAKTKDEAFSFIEAKKGKEITKGSIAMSSTNRDLANITKQQSSARSTIESKDPTSMSMLESIKASVPIMQEYANFAVDLYTNQQERMLQVTLDRIDREIEAEQKKLEREDSMNSGALELELISQGEYSRKKEELEENFSKKKDSLQRKAFEAEKKAEIKMASIKGTQRLAEIALNVLTAESKKGLFGLGTAATAIALYTPLAVAQTAAEVASISKKEYIPQKFATGGLIKGESHSNGGVPFTVNGNSGFEAEGGEFIVRKSATSKYFNELTQMNNDTFDRNSYYYNSEALIERIDVLIKQNSKPLRAFVTENDLRNDEVARKTKQNRATV